MPATLRRWKTASGEPRSAWVAAFYDDDGSRVRKLGFETKAAAEEWEIAEKRRLAALAKAAPITIDTVGALAEAWVSRARNGDAFNEPLSPGTYEGYAQIVAGYIKPYLGQTKLSDLTVPLIIATADRIKQDTGTNVANRVVRYLSIAMSFGVQKGYLPVNILMQVRLRGKAKSKALPAHKLPTRAEVHAINEHLIGLARGAPSRWLRFVTLFRTLAGTGVRIGEAMALKWSDFDPVKARLTIQRSADAKRRLNVTKSEAGMRSIVLDGDVIEWLDRWKAYSPWTAPDDFIFGNTSGHLDTRQNLYNRYWRPVCAELGITKPSTRRFAQPGDLSPRFAFHGFRHYRASELLSNKTPLKDAQDQMGHASASMTMDVYGHLFEDDRENLRERVAAISTKMALQNFPTEEGLRRKVGRPRKSRAPKIDNEPVT